MYLAIFRSRIQHWVSKIEELVVPKTIPPHCCWSRIWNFSLFFQRAPEAALRSPGLSVLDMKGLKPRRKQNSQVSQNVCHCVVKLMGFYHHWLLITWDICLVNGTQSSPIRRPELRAVFAWVTQSAAAGPLLCVKPPAHESLAGSRPMQWREFTCCAVAKPVHVTSIVLSLSASSLHSLSSLWLPSATGWHSILCL